MISLKLTTKESQNLTKDEIEIAMARKLEILMLPHLRRNLRFFYAGGNLKGKAEAYREPLDKRKVEEAIAHKKNNGLSTVCKPLCKMAAEILRENGIKAETVSCDTDMFRHTDVLITTRTGKKYIINYLEDIENIQTGMKTPDFASEQYYKRRYEKFGNGLTTDGKSLEGIQFLHEQDLFKIDRNLGYIKNNMYMNEVINTIKKEFLNFRTIMAENEWLTKQLELEKIEKPLEDKEKIKQQIYSKYKKMSLEEEIEAKLDWVFNNFNHRMNISGHTDFVMYYTRLLFKEIFTQEELSRMTKYDCFINKGKISNDFKIRSILEFRRE